MQKFDVVTSTAVPLGLANVDTDMIIPARFLRKPREEGFGGFAFYDRRYNDDGSPADFILNDRRYERAKILVGGANFGCGSSREGAVWALMDYGFRVVIAPSFADIFRGNCAKNGLLAVKLPEDDVEALLERIAADPDLELKVDLPGQTVELARNGERGRFEFEIDAFHKRCLVEGLSDLDLARRAEGAIEAMYAKRVAEVPGVLPVRPSD